MPFLTLKMTPGATKKQKARLIKDLTQVIVDVLGKDPQATRVVIQEIPADDWGVGGESLASRRKRGL
jgi:4-oxalocrotonate tautomerase